MNVYCGAEGAIIFVCCKAVFEDVSNSECVMHSGSFWNLFVYPPSKKMLFPLK